MILRQKRGLMTIFIIIAIVIVVGILVYFLVRGEFDVSGIPSELQPVFDLYAECVKEETKAAIELAGSQGGYIEVPAYMHGSEYAPFSSQLNFLGFPVPYWYYVSGNGLVKEQIPSKRDIEDSMARYVEEKVKDCNFDSFYAQGYNIEIGKPDVRVKIGDEKVNVEVNSDLIVSKSETKARKDKYEVEVNSKIGKFYNLARKIYDKEKKEAILDNYAVDVLRLYAPVDGVEISCSGKIWKTNDVINELKLGLEANMGALKFKGDYYDLTKKKSKYYEIDLGERVDENVNLIYSRIMPIKIEIVGESVDDRLMIASPVGIQEGLGILGFCYTPYHFVYDISFPLLIQIYNNDELFQFPVIVVIDNNDARQSLPADFEVGGDEEFNLCEFMTQDIEVNVYDINLNKADANISYQCFNQRCRLGESISGRFVGKAPSCLNGELLVRSDGFSDKKELFSTNTQRAVDVIMDKEYEIDLELKVGGKDLEGTSIVSFVRDDGKSLSTVLPDVSRIRLSEGNYKITVYVYGNSSISIPGGKKTQCQEVPRSGILGFFGSTKEKCFDIVIPETKIEYALRGGGKGETYLLPEQLEEGKLKLNVDSLPLPKSLEDLQYNYASFEQMEVSVL